MRVRLVDVARDLIDSLDAEISHGTMSVGAAARILRYTLDQLTSILAWDDEATQELVDRYQHHAWVGVVFREIGLEADLSED